jgi:hypothetical protein
MMHKNNGTGGVMMHKNNGTGGVMIYKNTVQRLTVLRSSLMKLATPRFEVKHKFLSCAISRNKENGTILL